MTFPRSLLVQQNEINRCRAHQRRPVTHYLLWDPWTALLPNYTHSKLWGTRPQRPSPQRRLGPSHSSLSADKSRKVVKSIAAFLFLQTGALALDRFSALATLLAQQKTAPGVIAGGSFYQDMYPSRGQWDGIIESEVRLAASEPLAPGPCGAPSGSPVSR